jgi:hypothetical protein
MQRMRNIRRFVVAGAVLGAAALTVTGQAAAKGCPGSTTNGGPSSVQQYVEQLPTSCGSTPTGGGTHHTKLPATVQKKIAAQGGTPATQNLLTKIATSQAYGAPQKVLVPKRDLPKLRGPKASGAGGRSALSASVSVVTDGSDGRLIALVALMAGIAVVALGASVVRRRAGR